MTKTDRTIGKSLLALAILPALIVGCTPAPSSTSHITFDNPPHVTDVYMDTTPPDDFVFYPVSLNILPKGATNLHHEGNGWYSFVWKGGCYLASAQDSGDPDPVVIVNIAHNKQVCQSNIPEEREEYEHFNTQY